MRQIDFAISLCLSICLSLSLCLSLPPLFQSICLCVCLSDSDCQTVCLSLSYCRVLLCSKYCRQSQATNIMSPAYMFILLYTAGKFNEFCFRFVWLLWSLMFRIYVHSIVGYTFLQVHKVEEKNRFIFLPTYNECEQFLELVSVGLVRFFPMSALRSGM